MKVEFKGGKDLEAALKALEVSVARKRGVASRALDKAAVPIRDEWQGSVDEDQGDLKRSVKIGNRAQTRATRKFKRSSGQDIVERFIGIDATEDKDGRLAVYAYIEEFGADGHPANPAGRQAWEAKKMESFDLIGPEMWAEIEKVAKRAKK